MKNLFKNIILISKKNGNQIMILTEEGRRYSVSWWNKIKMIKKSQKLIKINILISFNVSTRDILKWTTQASTPVRAETKKIDQVKIAGVKWNLVKIFREKVIINEVLGYFRTQLFWEKVLLLSIKVPAKWMMRNLKYTLLHLKSIMLKKVYHSFKENLPS